VEKKLTSEGYTEDQIFDKKLVGITAVTKLLGSKRTAEILEGLIIKPPGKPVLVKQADKRPEWNSAVEDFKEEVESDFLE
jgi:hypothetical protein